MPGRQVDIALITAAAHALADADDIFRIDQRAGMFGQLLMQTLGLTLAEVSQSAFHDGNVVEAARHHQADLAASAGQDGVQHTGAAVDVDAALAMHGFTVEAQGLRSIGHRLAIAQRLILAATDGFADRESAIRFDQDSVGHGAAGIKRENKIPRAADRCSGTAQGVSPQVVQSGARSAGPDDSRADAACVRYAQRAVTLAERSSHQSPASSAKGWAR